MRKIWIAVAAGLVGVGPLHAESLTDALISAYRNSHLLEQNQAVLRAADEDLATAVGSLRPVVNFQGSINAQGTFSPARRPDRFGGIDPLTGDAIFIPQDQQSELALSDTIALVASMPIFDFGRGKLGIALRNELVLASQQSLVNVEQEVLLDAVSAYVNVGLQTELVAAQQSNVRLISQDLRAAKDRFEVGEITRTDVALAEARLASANAALASSQGNYNIARERYNAAIGHYPTKLSRLPKWPGTAKTVAEAREIALRNHPVIVQAQHQAKASDHGVELARSQMQPKVDAEARLSQTFEGGENGLINEGIAITLNQTIYAGGQLSSALRQAIAQSQSAHAGLLQTVVNVDEAVGRAWSNILVANVSIEAGDEEVRAAQAAYDGVKQEAELGSRTLLDVLDADQDLLTAKANRFQAEANLYVSQYQLLSAMGLLTAEHLNLGIPTFDPNAYLNEVKNAPATSGRGARLDHILKTLGK
jgi:outer membrane protein